MDYLDPATQLALALNKAAQNRRADELEIREKAARLGIKQMQDASRGHRFSIVRTVRAMTAEGGAGLRDGIEAEVCQEAARAMGKAYDPSRVTVPWQHLASRVMAVGTATLGGNLVGDARGPAVDALFAHSTVIRNGAQVLSGLRADITVPRITGNSTSYWLAEQGTATASQGTIGQIVCTPKHIGAYTEMSRQLLLQSDAEAVLARHLLGLIGAGIDAAALAGTSADSTVPLGIRYAAGVAVSTGTSYTNATSMSLLKTVADGNARDDLTAFIGAQTTKQTLGNRAENGTGSRYIWSGSDIAGRPASVNSNAPANSLFVGDFSTVWIPTWGAGPTIELNPYASFQAGIVGLRCFASVDIAVTQPGAFAVSVGIT
jgi:HK97 family phage major capsid protein